MQVVTNELLFIRVNDTFLTITLFRMTNIFLMQLGNHLCFFLSSSAILFFNSIKRRLKSAAMFIHNFVDF
jgi:hypothetical protein